MAIEQYHLVEQQDIDDIYSSFNSFISQFGGPIQQLGSAPAVGALIHKSNINDINAKIGEFLTDTYLGSQPTWWTQFSPDKATGNLLYPADFNEINSTISNFPNVKCRNDAYHSHQNNGHGANSNGTNSYLSKENGGQQNGEYTSNGTCGVHGWCTPWGGSSFGSQGTWGSNGDHGNGTCGEGACGAHGTCKNTTYVDIANSYKNN